MSNAVCGPVPSRRLGRSLGADLVPFKTCSYDCIYCQLGRTTCKTIERREWVPLDDVLAELPEKLASKPDYVTLGGSGEPTLFSRLGEIIADFRGVHRETEFVAGREEILNTLRRRPCSIDDLADGLDMHRNEVIKHVTQIKTEGLLQESITAGKRYYEVK